MWTSANFQVKGVPAVSDNVRSSIVERCAEYIHDGVWSEWMKHVLDTCEEEINSADQKSGRLIIPSRRVEQWREQIGKEFHELSEEEKDIDREVARRVLNHLSSGIMNDVMNERRKSEEPT